MSVKDEFAGRKGKCPKCQSLIQIPGKAPAAAAASGSAAAPAKRPVGAAAKTETFSTANTETDLAPPKPGPKPAAGPLPKSPVPPAPKASAPTKTTAPAAKPAPPAGPSPEEVREQIAAAFAGQFQPPKVSLLRKLAMLIVVSIVLLLPLFYIVAVGLLVYGLYYVATGGLGLEGGALYAVLAVGVLVLLCLLKPLVAPRRRSVRNYPVDKTDEPALHDLVERVCEKLNAPRPKSIRLECSTYCGSAYRRGFLGYLTGDLGLTLGLPLAACLSVEQLASLIAGGLAPYRRRSGSGLMTLIGGINGWLWRSVFEPDRWDEWVNRHTSRPGMHAGKLLFPLKGVRIFSQIVLFIPMFIGNTVAAGLVKRTQYDADRCQARLAGKDDFEPIQQRAAVAAFNWEGVLSELNFLQKEGQLPDSLPKQLQLRMIDVTPELTSVLMESVIKREEKPFDSRPSDADRAAAIAAEPAEGAVTCDLPAWNLFKNYDKLGREITWDYYSAAYGKQLVHAAIKPVELPA
jgi:hypothetical protein